MARNLALNEPHAYLMPDEVAVWQFGKDGRVISTIDYASGSIDWSTFTTVSDRESIAANRIMEEAVKRAEFND